MLTKQDVQQLRAVIREEVRPIIQEEVKYEILPIKKDLKQMKTKLNRVAKDLAYVIGTYDERLVALEKGVQILKRN